MDSVAYTVVTVDRPQLPQCLQCLVDCKRLSQSHASFKSNPVQVKTAVGDTHSVFRAVYSAPQEETETTFFNILCIYSVMVHGSGTSFISN